MDWACSGLFGGFRADNGLVIGIWDLQETGRNPKETWWERASGLHFRRPTLDVLEEIAQNKP